MRIRRLVLDNVRCFRHLDLSFESGGDARLWTFIVGPNGTGKTTVLRSIGALGGTDKLRGGRLLSPSALRVRSKDGRVAVQFGDDAESRVTGFELSLLAGEETSHGPFMLHHGLLLGFGAVRPGDGRSRGKLGKQATRDSAHRGSLSSLFVQRTSRFSELCDWIRWEEFIRLKEVHHEAHRPSVLVELRRSLDTLFDGLAIFREVDTRGEILFDTPDGVVPLEELADGLRSIFLIVAELVLRLDAAFPESKAPLQEPAVCLIDELDAHLHPRLQRTVVPSLRSLFPNVQFIVTTHSPYVVGAAEPGEIVVLRRTPDGVVADLDVPDVTGWTADQIATSSIFGLDTTRDLRGEEALRTERDLLGKQELSPPEQQALDHARAVLDHADGPATAMVRRLLSLTGDPNTKARPASPKKSPSRNRHTSRTRKTGKELERSAPSTPATSVGTPPAKASKKAPKKKAR